MTPGEIQLKIIRLSLKLMLILIPIRENIEVWNWKLETCVCPYRYKGEIWCLMINPTLNHVKIIDQSLKLIIEHQSKLITSEHDVCKRLQMKFMWIQIQHVKFGGSTKLHDFYSIRTCKVWGSIKLHHLYSIDYRLSLSLTRWIHLQSIRKSEVWGSNNQDQLYSICKNCSLHWSKTIDSTIKNRCEFSFGSIKHCISNHKTDVFIGFSISDCANLDFKFRIEFARSCKILALAIENHWFCYSVKLQNSILKTCKNWFCSYPKTIADSVKICKFLLFGPDQKLNFMIFWSWFLILGVGEETLKSWFSM